MLRCFDRYLSAEGLLRCELPRSITLERLAEATPREREDAAVPHLPRAPVRRVSVPPWVLRRCPQDRSLSAKASTADCRRILTHTEVQQPLQAVDQLTPSARTPLRHLVMPEVFRLLYGCGFRVNEALHLRVADVDLDRGVLTVREAKFGEDRLVLPALPLVRRLQGGAARSSRLHAAGVSPHSLRHTKGMHLLQSGVSLEMIRDFLGHVDAKTTQVYARANL